MGLAEKKFRTGDEDFQEWAMEAGYCEDCDLAVFDSDYGYSVCPYEDGAEAFRFCPHSENVEEYCDEVFEEREEVA